MEQQRIPVQFTYNDPSTLHDSRKVIVSWIAMTWIASMIIHSMYSFMLVRSLLYLLLIVVHIILHWHSHRLVRKNPWVYFMIQGLLVYASDFIMPSGPSMVALFPVLIAQSIGIYGNMAKIVSISVVYYILFLIAVFSQSPIELAVILLLLLVLMTMIAAAVAKLTLRQVHARIRMQTFLGELEQAHRKVEELTVANERQRMARDLHDTLAQGLAGLIMQLEAVDSHLSRSNVKRAHEIVQQAMVRARTTLKEARQAIDDLRSFAAAPVSLEQAIRDEADQFTQTTGLPVLLDLDLPDNLSKLIAEHGLHIIRECFTNVARHAKADHVELKMNWTNDSLIVHIVDNGKGFDAANIGKRAGSYGLIGIQERIRILNGTLEINSSSKGTEIRIELPL